MAVKTFRIRLHGREQEVEVEELGAPAGEQSLGAPADGRISKVLVQAGQDVQAGDVLFVLDAKNMSYEIVAPYAGTIGVLKTQAGASVHSGDVLGTLKQ